MVAWVGRKINAIETEGEREREVCALGSEFRSPNFFIEIVRRVSQITSQFPTTFANRLEMLRQMESVEAEKRALAEEGERKGRAIQEKEAQISSLGEECDRLKLAHSSEVEQLRLQFSDLNTQNQLAKTENDAEIAELNSKAGVLESQVETLLQEREQSANQLTEARNQHEMQLRRERQEFEAQLTNERETNRKLTTDIHDLQVGITKLYRIRDCIEGYHHSNERCCC